MRDDLRRSEATAIGRLTQWFLYRSWYIDKEERWMWLVIRVEEKPGRRQREHGPRAAGRQASVSFYLQWAAAKRKSEDGGRLVGVCLRSPPCAAWCVWVATSQSQGNPQSTNRRSLSHSSRGIERWTDSIPLLLTVIPHSAHLLSHKTNSHSLRVVMSTTFCPTTLPHK